MTYPQTVAQATGYAPPMRSADRLVNQAFARVEQSDDLIYGIEELEEARVDYNIAEEYYCGNRPEFFASKAFRRALERTGTTFRLNYAKTPVDTVVERLEIIDIVGGDDPTRKMLQAIWEINQMDIESQDINRRACEFGDAYAIVWPSDDPSVGDDSLLDETGSDQPPSVGIDIFYNDPRTMRAIYDDENPRRMRYAIKFWCSNEAKGRRTFRANLYYKDRIEKYTTVPGQKYTNHESWVKYDDGTGIWPIPNPFDKIPVFHFRNDRPYGVPEHKDAYGPQDAITKIVITQMTTMDYHSFPQRWALANDDLDESDDEGEDFGVEDNIANNTDAQAEQVDASTGVSDLRAEPGNVWLLRGVKGVGQFDTAGSDVFDTPLKTFVRAMAQVTRTPVHRFDESGNPPSGESLKVREIPFVKKVKNRQMVLGATWNDLLGFIVEIIKQLAPNQLVKVPNVPDPNEPLQLQLADALPLGQQDEGADFSGSEFENDQGIPSKVSVSWANPASTDDQLTWDIVLLKRNAGVPARATLLEAGYSKKILDEWGVPPSKWEEYKPPNAQTGAPAQGVPAQLDLPVESPTHIPGIRANPTQTVGKLD